MVDPNYANTQRLVVLEKSAFVVKSRRIVRDRPSDVAVVHQHLKRRLG